MTALRAQLTALLVTTGLIGWAPVRAAEPTATELAKALQQKYSSIRNFSADFVSEYRTVLKKRLVERGTVLVQKPGRMRWEYKTPEEKLFVSDGIKLYSYVRQDRQTYVSAIPSDDKATTPMLFLAGKGDITRDFTASNVEVPAGMPAGSRALRLTPKVPQDQDDWLTVTFDAKTFAMRGLATLDAQGGTSAFTFTNWKENIKVPDRVFTYTPERGVDVITDTSK